MTSQSNQPIAVILAAGKGTRMKSALPKVLHPVAGEPMVWHVIRAAQTANCSPLVLVSAPDTPQVAESTQGLDDQLLIAEQSKQLGTADAVKAARDALKDHSGNVVVLFGDSPLITAETIAAMHRQLARDARLGAVIFGFETTADSAYGRLICDDDGMLERIVEAKDASDAERAVTLVNSGVMCLRGSLIWDAIEQIGSANAQNEYYLTDIVAIIRRMGYGCAVHRGAAQEALGINSRAQLAEVEAIMQDRLRARAMAGGVTMHDPASVYLCADTSFGHDVTLQPGVFFGPGVSVGDNVEIRAFSHIEGTVIGNGAMVGPFARLRPGTNIGEDCKIGNFVETKKAVIEKGAKISHLSYIGDAFVGEDANIGAGTITCNYDGYKKYHTEIGRDVFIGSNTALVAPVVVGSGAYVGAGSVVTENVQADSLAVARSRQSHKDDWAKQFRARMKPE